jgi:hypothetical protein
MTILTLLLVASSVGQQQQPVADMLFQHVGDRASQSVFGSSSKSSISLWTVAACNVSQDKLTIAREQVLMIAPQVTWLPNDLAEDIVSRDVAANPVTVIGTQGNRFISLATTITTAAGIAAKSPNTVYAAAAGSLLTLVLNMVKVQGPQPRPYFSRLLPESFSLASKTCATYYLFGTSSTTAPQSIRGTL